LRFQTPNVLAYQSEEATPTPTLEPTVTFPPEENPPTFTNTPEATFTAQPPETATSLPSLTPSAVAENSADQTSKDSPPLPILIGVYEPDEVLIRFKKSATEENIMQCVSSSNTTVLSSIEELNVWVVQVPLGKVAESIAAITACPDVRNAEPNYMASIADTIPSDPSWNLQKVNLDNIHAPQGWDYSTGSAAVTIAIVDSGVDLSHADLASKIVPGYDFVNGDSIPQDDFGHGTHVAGIAAAISNNGIGVTGISWGARIMPIKVLDAGGNGSFANVADGIVWATDHGAQVINLSLGGASSSTVLQDAVNYAYGKGVVLVAAAGNTGSNFILYPARYPNVIAVGAVDSSKNHAGFSNYGPELDLVAPGSSIYSTVIGGYDYKSGTSMAAPYVSGLAAILRAYPAGYSPAGITLALESSALDLGAPGFDNLYGHGLIQMDHAIQLVYIPPIPTFTLTPIFTLTSVPTLKFSPNLSGNQFQPSGNGFASTWTQTPFPSQTPSLIAAYTETSIEVVLPSKIPQKQEPTTPELYALSTPETGEKLPFSNFVLPCLGIVLILLGIWLFYIAGRRQERGRIRKRLL
jgi:thermitase